MLHYIVEMKLRMSSEKNIGSIEDHYQPGQSTKKVPVQHLSCCVELNLTEPLFLFPCLFLLAYYHQHRI